MSACVPIEKKGSQHMDECISTLQNHSVICQSDLKLMKQQSGNMVTQSKMSV